MREEGSVSESSSLLRHVLTCVHLSVACLTILFLARMSLANSSARAPLVSIMRASTDSDANEPADVAYDIVERMKEEEGSGTVGRRRGDEEVRRTGGSGTGLQQNTRANRGNVSNQLCMLHRHAR